jgi:hypothetical protein
VFYLKTGINSRQGDAEIIRLLVLFFPVDLFLGKRRKRSMEQAKKESGVFNLLAFVHCKYNIFLSLAVSIRYRNNRFVLKYLKIADGQEMHLPIRSDIDRLFYSD